MSNESIRNLRVKDLQRAAAKWPIIDANSPIISLNFSFGQYVETQLIFFQGKAVRLLLLYMAQLWDGVEWRRKVFSQAQG
jgi:hypothetical protein